MADHVAHVERKYAKLGGPGWDLDGNEVMKRATDVLTRSGVDPSLYDAMAPSSRDKSSSVDIFFKTERDLKVSGLMVRAQQIRCPGARTTAWLEPKRTREENKPARMTHRAHEAAEAFEQIHHADDQRLEISKDIATRTVSAKVKGAADPPAVYGKYTFGKWLWSDGAQQRMQVDLGDINRFVSA